ncbi:hypothetical protein WOLCODRAFT_139914 [Wolfiporia cocos MD-104 SS10]|uniref:Uncharacterized protein n=1 Tax=Wolfiporia cocos (strain MD-104) TaxID=742152 RepID=A0A2H3J1C9_WOLCO|nr:hypothetical protein WOLCODRAFT_139914 [Wolfiporia cocos MD-104 SS10]
MFVYNTWHAALSYHPFWRQACAMIDPTDSLLHHSIIRPTATAGSAHAAALRMSPYQHFRNITSCSCMVCRINVPYTCSGLAVAKRPVMTAMLGTIMTCRDHRKTSFCGVCLKEAPAMEGELEYAQGLSVVCVENEDEETWPGVEATCRYCRAEGLWRRAQPSATDREAIGGPRFESADWETRQAIDAFVDLGEGTVSEVLAVARDKHWYRQHTKLGDMLSQALAASRFASRVEAGETYTSEEDLSEEEEEDAELVSITEEAAGIREIAITDFARNRIMDGHWVNPADIWYKNEGARVVVPAQHPCPWHPGAVCTGMLQDGSEVDGEELEHPLEKTVKALAPPSQMLCNMSYHAFVKQMKDILLPPMRNIVRRIALECAADGKDAAVVAAAMTMDDVAEMLREEGTWWNGYDWVGHRVSQRERQRVREQHGEKDEETSSNSSRSGGSNMTSPVLSTTTLQTTPSPPPSGSVKEDETAPSPTGSNPPAIEVAPVLEHPVLIRPIPYIPVTVSHLPMFSLDVLKHVWREASLPLYECYCATCVRRIIKAHAAASSAAASQEQQQPAPQAARDPPVLQPPAEIKIPQLMRQEEEEEGEGEEEGEEGESEAEEDDSSLADALASPVGTVVAPPSTLRKRSSGELDADAGAGADTPPREGTPPKRPRIDAPRSPSPSPSPTPTLALSPAPARLRKRSSAELEEGGEPLQTGNGDAKRARAALPRSTTAADAA